jgi:hypothetical protein
LSTVSETIHFWSSKRPAFDREFTVAELVQLLEIRLEAGSRNTQCVRSKVKETPWTVFSSDAA